MRMEELLLKIAISLALGAIIGIERERRMKETFAGFRTFMLACLLGVISSYLSQILSISIVAIVLFFVGVLASINFYRKVIYRRGKGITTEISFILTFLIGVILYHESSPFILSTALAFSLTLILVLKESLHEFAHKVTTIEIEDFVTFGLVAFVIYPILPEFPIDPFGILNLKFIWKAIVAIFGLSFFVYSIFRILKTKGIFLSSVLGGLINSIYMSDFFSSQIKKPISYPFIASVSSMLLRIYILSIIINPGLVFFNIFLLLTAISGYVISYVLSRKTNKKNEKINIVIKSPLSFKFVAIYIPIFALLFFIANLTSKNFGLFGAKIMAMIVGLIDTSSLATVFSTFSGDVARLLLLFLTSSNIIGNSLFILKNNKEVFKKTFNYLLLLILLNIFFFLLLS
jgi:uncharacterized membrane protein (DUF4010 family)